MWMLFVSASLIG